jgi:hypothetical protein
MASQDITESGVQEVLRTMGIPSSFKGFREDVTGRAEALATVGSGMAGTMAGMGGGLFEMLRSGNPQAALDQYRQIQEAMTFVPRTQKGLENVQDIGEFFEPVANIYERFGESVAEQTGSPVVGEFTQEFVDPLDLMGLGAVSAIPAIARKSRFAENIASQTTQRANTVGTAVKASNYLDEIGAKGKTLDYGAGLGENAKAIKADETFEPFPQGEFNPTYTDPAQVPANAYGRIISTNVLNVLPPDIRQEAVLTIGNALEPGGTALIQTWDVGAAKAGMKSKKAIPVEGEENAYTTSTGSYQKGFSKQELQEYLTETLGPGFTVEPVPGKAGISGTAVTITKSAEDIAPKIEAAQASQRTLSELKQAQPVASVEDLYALAPQAQTQLVNTLKSATADYNVQIKNPGIKTRATTQEKFTRKGYKSANEFTDVSRAGMVVNSVADADAIIADLGKRLNILDEGWSMTPSGFVDRKVLVQTPSGMISEVQIWLPAMYDAKFAKGGQDLYTKWRSETDQAVKRDLEKQMQAIYSEATKADTELDQAFAAVAGTLKSPN